MSKQAHLVTSFHKKSYKALKYLSGKISEKNTEKAPQTLSNESQAYNFKKLQHVETTSCLKTKLED